MDVSRRKILMNTFFRSEFNYCPLIWMCYNRSLNHNRLHVRCLRIIYSDKKSSFDELLDKYESVSLSKLAGPLMKVALPLAKNVLAPLGLTAAMSAIDENIQKKIHESGVKLIIEQEDMKDIMKIIKALENSSILLKGVSKTIKNETKEQRGGFLSMLLGTLGASLLGNLLAGAKGIMRAGDGIVRAGAGSESKKKT